MLRFLAEKFPRDQLLALDKFRQVIWAADGYEPTVVQREWLFDDPNFKLVSGGVRSGKSKSGARALDWFAPLDGETIWIVGPDYNKAAVEFDYMIKPYRERGLIEQISDPIRDAPKVAKLRGGAKIETKSAMDPMKLSSVAPIAILNVEAGACSYEIVDKSFERGVEKDAYILLTGTIENSLIWYADLITELEQPGNRFNGRSYSMPTWSNSYIFPGGENDPKIMRARAAMPDELFMERFAAVPYRSSGLVYREFNPELHIKEVELDEELPVYLAIDPAYHTYAVVFLQVQGKKVVVLDEVYLHNAITQDIIPMVTGNPLWNRVKYGVIDTAARQRQGNKSVWQVWHEQTKLPLYSNYVEIQQGIDALKLRMRVDPEDGTPNFVVSDKLRQTRASGDLAGGLISEFALWRWPDGRRVNINTRRTPIDKNNDAIKAVQYFCYHYFGPVVERKQLARTKTRPVWVTRGYGSPSQQRRTYGAYR